MMSYFLPSEIAKLVLGYLTEENCHQTKTSFVEESSHLGEYRSLCSNTKLELPMVNLLPLSDILEQYGELHAIVKRMIRNGTCKEMKKSDNFLSSVKMILHKYSEMVCDQKTLSGVDDGIEKNVPEQKVFAATTDNIAQVPVKRKLGPRMIATVGTNPHSSLDSTLTLVQPSCDRKPIISPRPSLAQSTNAASGETVQVPQTCTNSANSSSMLPFQPAENSASPGCVSVIFPSSALQGNNVHVGLYSSPITSDGTKMALPEMKSASSAQKKNSDNDLNSTSSKSSSDPDDRYSMNTEKRKQSPSRLSIKRIRFGEDEKPNITESSTTTRQISFPVSRIVADSSKKLHNARWNGTDSERKSTRSIKSSSYASENSILRKSPSTEEPCTVSNSRTVLLDQGPDRLITIIRDKNNSSGGSQSAPEYEELQNQDNTDYPTQFGDSLTTSNNLVKVTKRKNPIVHTQKSATDTVSQSTSGFWTKGSDLANRSDPPASRSSMSLEEYFTPRKTYCGINSRNDRYLIRDLREYCTNRLKCERSNNQRLSSHQINRPLRRRPQIQATRNFYSYRPQYPRSDGDPIPCLMEENGRYCGYQEEITTDYSSRSHFYPRKSF